MFWGLCYRSKTNKNEETEANFEEKNKNVGICLLF